MARRRGNPNWGKAMENLPVVPSRFEKLVMELGLTDRPGEWVQSEPLRQWAKEHRDYHYVPERLLAAWRLLVREND